MPDELMNKKKFLEGVATFFNVAGTKLDFWTFAKDFDENGRFQNSSNLFSYKFLSKTEILHNEIQENIIDNDENEPVPEYDTAIEREESNKEERESSRCDVSFDI